MIEDFKSAFRPPHSLLRDQYVVFYRGLGDDRRNEILYRQANTYVDRTLYNKSMDVRSGFYKFLTYLQAIADAEQAKEISYINAKLDSLRGQIPDDYLNEVKQFVDAGDISSAYTMIQRRNKDLQELVRELTSSHFNNTQHMNEFWQVSFPNWFQKKLATYLEPRFKTKSSGELVLREDADLSVSINTLVEDYITEMFEGTNVIQDSTKLLQESLRRDLKEFFIKKGVLDKDTATYDSILFKQNTSYTKLTNNSIVSRKKVVSTDIPKLNKMSTILQNVGNAIGKGIGAEIANILANDKNNGAAFNTGQLLHNSAKFLGGESKNVYVTTDGISFQYEGKVDIDIQAITSALYNELQPRTLDDIEILRQRLESTLVAAGAELSSLFEIDTNVKGYMTYKQDGELGVVYDGSFNSKMGRLQEIMNNSPNKGNLDFQKLIFLLNNTTPNAVAEGREDRIATYIAAICVAWMWDDGADLFQPDPAIMNNGPQRIHLFQSGTAYFTASDIISYTVEQLKNMKQRDDMFVHVSITPAPTFTDAEYMELKDQYPVNYEMSESEWQSQLQQRWDYVRNKTIEQGRLKISFRQTELEKLLNGFRSLGG